MNPCTKSPDQEESCKSINDILSQSKKLSAEYNCEMLMNIYFDTSIFTSLFQKQYDVYVVYRIPINLKFGQTERFQFVQDGIYHPKQRFQFVEEFYRKWPYKNDIARYVAAIKNKTGPKPPLKAWELTLTSIHKKQDRSRESSRRAQTCKIATGSLSACDQ